MTDYQQFLEAKVDFDSRTGFHIDVDDIHPALKPHQRLVVQWAVRGGRRALFEAFGLGKTIQQLEILRQILHREGGRALIVCPLGVRGEFARDARQHLGIDTRFVRRDHEVDGDGIYITNYESVRDGKLDPSQFIAVSLDEASILRSYGSKTYQTFLPLFETVQYRFVATATPSPNRYKELIHYAGYLGIMDTGSALTRFFKRDSTKANNLTLHPHHEKTFWLWLNSWAIFLQSPGDIGCDNTGYDLPALDVRWHEIDADHTAVNVDRDGVAPLFKGAAMSLVDASREKRDTISARVAQMMEIIDEQIQPQVLPREPGEAARAGAGTLREHERGSCGEEASVPTRLLREESGAPSSSAARARAEVLRGEQGQSRDPQSSKLAQESVRNLGGAIRGDAGESGAQVCDLRSSGEQFAEQKPMRGPLPRDGRSPRSALPAVQHGAGNVRGRSEADGGSDQLPSQVVIWCDLNAEQRAIERALDGAGITYSSIYGALDPDEAERRLDDWRAERTTALVGKPVMLGQGMNLQQCNIAIFVGITHKFNDFIQATHRIQRFGQTRPCTVHIINADSEREVKASLLEKWSQHKELTRNMTDVINTH